MGAIIIEGVGEVGYHIEHKLAVYGWRGERARSDR